MPCHLLPPRMASQALSRLLGWEMGEVGHGLSPFCALPHHPIHPSGSCWTALPPHRCPLVLDHPDSLAIPAPQSPLGTLAEFFSMCWLGSLSHSQPCRWTEPSPPPTAMGKMPIRTSCFPSTHLLPNALPLIITVSRGFLSLAVGKDLMNAPLRGRYFLPSIAKRLNGLYKCIKH